MKTLYITNKLYNIIYLSDRNKKYYPKSPPIYKVKVGQKLTFKFYQGNGFNVYDSNKKFLFVIGGNINTNIRFSDGTNIIFEPNPSVNLPNLPNLPNLIQNTGVATVINPNNLFPIFSFLFTNYSFNAKEEDTLTSINLINNETDTLYYINDNKSGYDCCKQVLLNKTLAQHEINIIIGNLIFYKELMVKDKEAIKLFHSVDDALYKNNELRACIGTSDTNHDEYTIETNVKRFIKELSTNETKCRGLLFKPITFDEINDITFNINILYHMKSINVDTFNSNQFNFGCDGLLFKPSVNDTKQCKYSLTSLLGCHLVAKNNFCQVSRN
jgi:hypothetical protein